MPTLNILQLTQLKIIIVLFIMIMLHSDSIAQVGKDQAIDTTMKVVSKIGDDLTIDSAKREIIQTLKNQIDSLKLFIIANKDDGKDLVGVLTMTNKEIPMYKKNVRESNKYVNYTNADTCEYYNDSLYKVSTIYNRVYYRKIIGDTIAYVIRKYRLQGLLSRKMRKMVCKCTPIKDIKVDKITIDSIIIRTEIGEILSIQVFSRINGKTVRFSNQSAPILLTSKRFTKIDRLYSDNDKKYIILNEVLQYTVYKSYFPDKSDFVLDSSTLKKKLCKSNGINAQLDIGLYSDALGVFGGKSNGLVQTDVTGKFAVGHISWPRNTGIRWLKFVGLNLVASKFDSKVATTMKNNNIYNRTELFQRSWLSANVFTTLASGWFAKGSSDTWGADFGGGVDLSQLGDTITDTVTTLSTYWMGRLYATFVISDNFDFNFSCTGVLHYNTDTEKIGGQTRDKFFIQPQLLLSWHPQGNPSSRIFSRIKFVRESNTSDKQFLQVQFGYSLLLSSIVKKE